MSLMIATVHKYGYRNILLVLPPMTAIFMALTCVTTNQIIIMIAYTISWTAIGVYDLMYPLMWTSYVPGKITTKMFSVVMIVNLITQTIYTFFGGKAVVWFFSLLQGTSYRDASIASGRLELMHGQVLANYTNAYRILLVITAAVTMLAFILALFIHDVPRDYRSEASEESTTPAQKAAMYKKLLNKRTIMWIVYIAGVQLGARLIAVYVPIYLNNYLHIPRDVSSSAIGVYDLMYPLMWTSYVPSKIRTKMFTVVMVVNLIAESIMMFIGGKAVVFIFSKLQGISYQTASNLSADSNAMKGAMLSNYISAYKWVNIITAVITFIAFVLALFIKDKPIDYRSTESKDKKETLQQKMTTYKRLVNYKTVVWVLYLCAVQLGAGLFIQYVPIYLNNILHIPRGITSTINTLQTVAIFVGYFFAPYLAKKLGSIMTIAISTIICVPLMLVMANAKMLGTGAALFAVVGTILFFRSGLANASMPVQQEVQMILVDKDMRPAFSAVIEIALSVVGVIDGLFTEFYLLKTQQGYANAYIIAAALYIVSGVVLILVFAKKYNRILRDSHASEESK